MPVHLILTVGTGTAGKHSNLAAGLRRTLEMIAPERFWLVPSSSPDSIAVADLVREDFRGFQPWAGDDMPYRCIAQHDSLANCREAVREVIAVARRAGKIARLLVNPTSGTKQMSAGATLAALDEGVGEIVFTVGERADGVVMTGTEKLESFDPSAFFAERDLATAADLFSAGAFGAAARILRRHEALRPAQEVAVCLHEWDRLNYEAARQSAARSKHAAFTPVLRGHLQQLAQEARPGSAPSAVIAADLLDNAAHHHARGDSEGSLVLAVKALETGLRHLLWSQTQLRDPYPLTELYALPVPADMKERLEKTSNDGKTTILGLKLVAEVLKHLGDPVGTAYFADRELQALVRVRNDLTHLIRSVSQEESAAALARVKALLPAMPKVPARPSVLDFLP